MSDDPSDITDDNEPDIDERSIAQVGSPSRHTNVLVVIFGVAIVGMLLWFVNHGADSTRTSRTARAQTRIPRCARHRPTGASPDAPVIAPPDPFQMELQRRALRDAEEQRRLAEQRRRAPSLILDTRRDQAPSSTRMSTLNAPASAANGADTIASELVASAVDRVTATTITHKSHTIAQGALIRAVLETAIQSDLPGFIRAEVAHDVYSFDGSRLLIPKASRLIGEYRSALVRGQTRVFVVWNRLLRPDGVSILIGSPGTDLLGRVGLAGDLDTHFFKIFGASILLSLIDGAISIAVESVRDSSGTSTTVLQNTNSLNRAADIALENSINIPPTIYVDQGTAIQVFVARDLDFFDVTP